MPIVTQSRPLAFKPRGDEEILVDGVEQTPNMFYYSVPHPPGNQITTSYRSRGAQGQTDWIDDVRDLSGPELRDQIRLDAGRAGFIPSTFDNGHEFLMDKTEFSLSHDIARFSRPVQPGYLTGAVDYRGPISADIYSIPFNPNSLTNSVPDLSQKIEDGTELVKRTIPTAPSAGLAQFLGELREGIPSLTGMILFRKGVTSKNFGSEYLNYQFALAPMIRDIQRMATSVLTANKQIRAYLRDSGRNVRRRRTLYDISSFQNIGTTYTYGGLHGYALGVPVTNLLIANSGDQRVDVWDTTRHRCWFSGAYTYYASEDKGILEHMRLYDQLANKLLGTRLTASLVWELTPWSWLIDWFSDLGTFVSNAESFSSDGLVMRYGYVMHHTVTERTYRISNLRDIHGVVRPAYYISVRKEQKSRLRATPYGFGLDLEMLDPRQWAILGALGISSGGAPTLRRRS
jgi:hypothetical protein